MSAGTIRRKNRAQASVRAQERRDAAAAQKQERLANTKMTRRGRRPIKPSTAAAAATAGAAAGVAASDAASISAEAKAETTNPFEGFAGSSSEVTVAEGDNLSTLLKKMGYSSSEIHGENGALAQVMKANPDIKNANLIYPGQELNLPMKEKGEASSSGATASPNSAESTAAAVAEAYAPSESAAAEASPEAQGPTITKLPLNQQSTSQLEGTALAAREQGKAHMEDMFNQIGGLNEDDNKSARRAMFYQTAADSGLFGQASPGQIRDYFAANPGRKEEFEAAVRDWSDNNQLTSQKSMAMGAAGWAAANFDESAPADRKDQLLGIAQSAESSWNNNNLAENAVYEVANRNLEAGAQLFYDVN